MIAIGKILKPWGIKGEVKVSPYNQNAFEGLKEVWIDEKVYTLKKCSVRVGYAYLLIEGFDTPEASERLRDKELFAPKDVLGALNADEYLIEDMIGLLVVDDTGCEWGKVVSIEQYGSADVYTVVGRKGENRFPFLSELIKDINLEKRVMTVSSEKLSEVVVCG